MTARLALLWILVLAASAAAVLFAGRSAAASHARADVATRSLEAIQSQARELAALQAAARSAPSRPSAGSGLASRMAAALSSARLPASALSGVSPEPAGTVSSGAKRQRASINLSGLTLPQVGALLAAWRTAEPGWTVTRIDLSPLNQPQGGQGAANTGGDLPLRISLGLEALEPSPGANP